MNKDNSSSVTLLVSQLRPANSSRNADNSVSLIGLLIATIATFLKPGTACNWAVRSCELCLFSRIINKWVLTSSVVDPKNTCPFPAIFSTAGTTCLLPGEAVTEIIYPTVIMMFSNCHCLAYCHKFKVALFRQLLSKIRIYTDIVRHQQLR